ncbi:MAG TPA: SdrD B-like domain-containing protein [Caldilineaceae bacterium]|nr:SdrD B-like domain-containing protein [Caldilineaceae bacterium]
MMAQLLLQPILLVTTPLARALAAPHQEEEGDVVLPAPVQVYPDDGIRTTGRTHPPVGVPRLSWKPVAGATIYHVEISNTAGFSQVIAWAKTANTTYITYGALPNDTYYWRVRAGTTSTNWGEYSPVRTFTKDWTDNGTFVPQLVSPPDGSERAAFTNDDFTWQPFQGAARYRFEISTDPNFSNVIYSTITIKAGHTPTKRLANNLYYWRVTPIDARDRFGESSEVWSFQFNWKNQPVLLSPENNIDVAFIPRFSWTAVQSASKYELQISTQEDFGLPTTYQTTNTEYTPEKALSNDQDYYWRVKAIDAEKNSSPWSEVRQFRVRWNFQPTQLAPTNGVISQSHPFFAWTPIPGAEQYQVQVDETTSYERPLLDEPFYNVTTAAIVKIEETTVYIGADYFWRVRGIDAQGNYTPWSNNNSFRYGYTGSPNLVYPLPYYVPDEVTTPVHSDRTIAWPMFAWDSGVMFHNTSNTVSIPQYYEVTVAADAFFSDVRFQVETAGLFAAPTTLHPFTNLEDGKIYYWRVRAFLADGTQVGVDQTWQTRIDRSVPERAYAESITPIFPADGFEAVETPPILGWSPIAGAAHYHLQIAKDLNFNELVEDVNPQFVNYAPWQGRRLSMPMGTYYWRVRAESAPDVPIGGWSEVRHFNLSQDLMTGNKFDFQTPQYPGSILEDGDHYRPELTHVATSTTNGLGDYELGDLHIMLNRIHLKAGDYPKSTDNYNWIFAFQVSPSVSNPVRYALYIDTDHIAGSGATVDLMGKPISSANLYLPEYMIVVVRDDNTITPSDATVYAWGNGAWAPGLTLSNLGGDAWYASNNVIQLLVPYTSIGTNTEDFSGSIAVALISTSTSSSEGIFDSVPAQENNIIDAPVFVSNMLMPLFPFDTPLSNPIIYEDMPPLRWRMPYFDSIDGYEVEVARDAKFTDIVENWELSESQTSTFFPFLTTVFQSRNAYEDNESYYWRVRLRHERYGNVLTSYDYSSWSPPMRFKLSSRKVGNPTLSTGNLAETTPSFWWDRVEGASGYTIQIDEDSNFSSPTTVKVDGTSYTPLNQLPDGTYYWRVAMRRSRTVLGQWSPTMSFVKQSVAPTPLSPINNQIINEQPTFKWTAVLTPTTTPRVAAPNYQIQFDDDPNFGTPLKYTTQSTSFTIPSERSLPDGTFYWRVAMIDASGNVGTFSKPQQFYKEYLTPNAISPVENEPFTKSTTFEWDPMPGAAYYQVELDDDPLFNSPVRDNNSNKTDNTVYTPVAELTESQYYWRVRMFDYNRNPGPWFGGKINVQEVNLSLGNYVWVDANNNGVVDEGESPVPDGVVVELLDGAGASLDRTTTTFNGFYLFKGLDNGEYRVRLAASNFAEEGLLPNYSHSSGTAQEKDPNSDGDQNDNGLDTSDPALEGITSPKIAMIEGEEPIEEMPTQAGNPGDDGNGTTDSHSNLTVDFGVVSPENTYSIGNFIGVDANNDGQIDLDDKGKPVGLPKGVLLELLFGDGTPTGRTTTTLSGGYYIFAGLSAGSYRVRIAASNFAAGGILVKYGHSTGSDQESDPNNNGDQNDNGLDEGSPSSVGIRSGIILLGDDEPINEMTTESNQAGQDGRTTPDAHSNLTIDFALSPNAPTGVGDNFIFLPIVSK